MTGIAAVGELLRVRGFGLAGASVHVAETPESVVDAWQSLDERIEVVILTPSAAAALGDAVRARPEVLVVVMPM